MLKKSSVTQFLFESDERRTRESQVPTVYVKFHAEYQIYITIVLQYFHLIKYKQNDLLQNN